MSCVSKILCEIIKDKNKSSGTKIKWNDVFGEIILPKYREDFDNWIKNLSAKFEKLNDDEKEYICLYACITNSMSVEGAEMTKSEKTRFLEQHTDKKDEEEPFKDQDKIFRIYLKVSREEDKLEITVSHFKKIVNLYKELHGKDKTISDCQTIVKDCIKDIWDKLGEKDLHLQFRSLSIKNDSPAKGKQARASRSSLPKSKPEEGKDIAKQTVPKAKGKKAPTSDVKATGSQTICNVILNLKQ